MLCCWSILIAGVTVFLTASASAAPASDAPEPLVFQLTPVSEVFDEAAPPHLVEPAPDDEPDVFLIPTGVPAPLFRQIQAERPLAPAPSQNMQPPAPQPDATQRLSASIFGPGNTDRSLLSQVRRSSAPSSNSQTILGQEARTRVTSDAGSLLGKAPAVQGMTVQRRTPIVNDPRVRGSRVGQLVASGSYWVPARMDLDTMLSKIDSRSIQRMNVVKGPYSALYGPGFDFIDVDLVPAPRYANGTEWHGSTLTEYQANGQQLYGRQSVWGGAENWGARVDYGYRTGNDYKTGAGTHIPSSYQSGDLNAVASVDFSPDSHLEFRYLHLDQYNVEYPGLVFDMNHLYTDGYEVNYALEDQDRFDLLTVEAWYNRTRFDGDTFRSGKNTQIPTLGQQLFPFNGAGTAITNADTASTGSQALVSWGEVGSRRFTAGLDVRYLNQELNDIENQRPDVLATGRSRNFPLPASHSANPGLLAEFQQPLVDGRLRLRTGGRVDGVFTNAANNVPGRIITISEFQGGVPLDRHFCLFSIYGGADYDLDAHWTASASAGYAQRPPTLTELYAAGPFIGTLQPGLTYMVGDATLAPERRTQVDAALKADYGEFRGSLRGFFAWANNYITYDAVQGTPANLGQEFYQVAFTNTDLAVLSGVEGYEEYDLNRWLTTFGSLSYLQGTDLTRTNPGRMAALLRTRAGQPAAPRSEYADASTEPLPGIVPLESRLGLRWHQPGPAPRYGVELATRIVATQNRVAYSLGERRTGGFTVWDIRGYWKTTDNLFLTCGVENFTNKFYREHLDYRTGLGVFQPGINFYLGAELVY